MSFLQQAAIFLAAAVIAVPLFRRLGFGSVLGYLAAGVLIGPWGLRLAGGGDSTLHFAELGVELLLFVIGLELKPSRLWVLRKSVFGMGTTQVVATGVLLSGLARLAGLGWPAAIITGFGLSLSSTAFAVQMLAEKKELTTQHGRAAFAILLFQDLAVIPLLALLRLFAVGTTGAETNGVFTTGLTIVGAIAFIVIGGRYLLRPLLRIVAAAGSQEIFTAAALLVVIGASLLMETVGLSMSLGAFLAGVLLADSVYRHELSADIEPFKGLLLGLFFIAVGMTADLGLIAAQPLRVIGYTAALLAVKFTLLYALGKLYRLPDAAPRNLAFSISQGGEFAFVLFTTATGYGVLDRSLADLLIVVVTLSMAATPLLVLFNEKALQPWLRASPARPFDTLDDHEQQVIIAGFGRFGQVIGRLLRVKKIPFTALEANPDQVEVVRRYGGKVYYGDASRLDLLRAARADKARILVVAVDDVAASLRITQTARRHFPRLEIYARARNRYHAHLLMDLGVTIISRETFLSSLDLAGRVLRGLGLEEAEVAYALDTFRRHDEQTLARQHAIFRDRDKLIQTGHEAAQELEELFEADVGDGGGDDRPARSRGGLRLDHGRIRTVPEDEKSEDP